MTNNKNIFVNSVDVTIKFLFRHERKEAELLRSLNEAEIEKEQETSTLLRAASLTTTLMDLYMKSVSTVFLQAAVQETIHKLLESKQSCEVSCAQLFFPSYFWQNEFSA